MEAARESEALAERAREVAERGRHRLEEVDRETAAYVRPALAEAGESRRGIRTGASARPRKRRPKSDARKSLKMSRKRSSKSKVRLRKHSGEQRSLSRTRPARGGGEATGRRGGPSCATGRRGGRADRTNLQTEARRRADEAEGRVEVVEELRERAAATANRTSRELADDHGNGLDSYKKPELVELAGSIGIRGRTDMTKGELVDAIMTAARRSARQGARS